MYSHTIFLFGIVLQFDLSFHYIVANLANLWVLIISIKKSYVIIIILKGTLKKFYKSVCFCRAYFSSIYIYHILTFYTEEHSSRNQRTLLLTQLPFWRNCWEHLSIISVMGKECGIRNWKTGFSVSTQSLAIWVTLDRLLNCFELKCSYW